MAKRRPSVEEALASITDAEHAAVEGLATVTNLEPRLGLPTRELPLSALLDNPDNPRTDYTDLDELANSIGEVGVLQPILVRPLSPEERPAHPDRTHMIIAGHRRRRASERAGLSSIPVVERNHRGGEGLGGDLILMLTENIQRSDITPMDEARSFKVLADAGLTQTQIAQALGVSQSKVSKRLALVDLHPVIQTGIARGAIGAEAAPAFRGAPMAVQQRAGEKLLQRDDDQNEGAVTMATPAVVQESIHRAEREISAEGRVAAATKLAEEAGAQILKSTDSRVRQRDRELVEPTPAQLEKLAAAGHLGAVIERWRERPTFYNVDPKFTTKEKAREDRRREVELQRLEREAERAALVDDALRRWAQESSPSATDIIAVLASEVARSGYDAAMATAYRWMTGSEVDDLAERGEDLDGWFSSLKPSAQGRFALIVLAARDAEWGSRGATEPRGRTVERIRLTNPELAEELLRAQKGSDSR